MKFLTLTIITSLMLWPIAGSAELYKWTDEQGNLHITDAPPPELHQKSGPAVKPSPRSAQPIKTTPRPTSSELSRGEVRPVPEPAITSTVSEDATRLDMAGLNPNQATVTSAWQTFDSAQVVAKVPVQRWKDERGVEHFVDQLPPPKSSTGGKAMPKKRRPTTP